ncbi:50S ribosomal protein L4 [Candidatus Pacearchaeota archaeon]|nr:50S ribosomal protein L4 [Candidatus Pacearchaeota archaeon]
MKSDVFSVEGKKLKEIELPNFFSEKIREDLIAKVLESKKIIQPYAPMQYAGMLYSASGKIRHKRHAWKISYGRGMSRVPRKIMSRRGSQFQWVGATTPHTRGGRRAHPPKLLHILKRKKMNKKEINLALVSALSATANEKEVRKKYSRLRDIEIKNLPFIVESRILSLKTKELIEVLKKILGEKVFDVGIRNKDVRTGKGKIRGRKYKENAGLLIVTGKNEKMKTKMFDVANTNNLGVLDLAEGGQGRITIYTEQAINELKERFNNPSKIGQIKEGGRLK